MRLIDADALSAWLNERLRCCNKKSIVEACFWAVLDMVDSMPAVSPPPNDPLTLEELQEMSRDWVWIKLLVPLYRMETGYYIKKNPVFRRGQILLRISWYCDERSSVCRIWRYLAGIPPQAGGGNKRWKLSTKVKRSMCSHAHFAEENRGLRVLNGMGGGIGSVVSQPIKTEDPESLMLLNWVAWLQADKTKEAKP